jgi:hypothetical protein
MNNLGKENTGKIVMEVVWWLITMIVVWMVTNPLWIQFVDNTYINKLILYIIVLITYTRYLFLLKYTFLAHFQVMKFILIFISLPFVFYLINGFFAYKDFLDKQNQGMIEYNSFFREGITSEEKYATLAYLSKTYSFFAISAVIVVVYSPFKLLVSYWRVYNKTGRV